MSDKKPHIQGKSAAWLILDRAAQRAERERIEQQAREAGNPMDGGINAPFRKLHEGWPSSGIPEHRRMGHAALEEDLAAPPGGDPWLDPRKPWRREGFTDAHARVEGCSWVNTSARGAYVEGNSGPAYQDGDVVTFATAPPSGDFARVGWGGPYYGNLIVGGQLSFNGTAALAKWRLQTIIAIDRENAMLDGDLWRGYRWTRTGILKANQPDLMLKPVLRLERRR